MHDRSPRRVFEVHVAVFDAARPRRQLHGIGPVGHLLRLVHDLEDPLAGRSRALRLPDPHAEHAQRRNHHQHDDVEREECAVRERAVDHHPAADEDHRRLGEQRQEREQRDVERALPVRRDALAEDGLGGSLELRLLGLLLRERLDDVDAHDVLLGHGRDVRHLLLDVAQQRVRDVRVAVGEPDQKRRDPQRDERQLPVDEEHHGCRAHECERVLEEEDQPVPEEEAHRLEVDRRA